MAKSEYYFCVIGGAVKGSLAQRGKKYKHPVTKQEFIIGLNTEDAYFMDEFNLWPATIEQNPGCDPKRENPPVMSPLIVDTEAKTVTRGYTVTSMDANQAEEFITSEAARLFQENAGPVLSGYTSLEVKSWPLQYSAAKEYTDSGGAIVPDEIALLQAQRGGSALDCANSIITKSTAFKDAYYPALGRRQYIDDLNAQTITLLDKLDIIDNNLYVLWTI
jgi:hypothetical protein